MPDAAAAVVAADLVAGRAVPLHPVHLLPLQTPEGRYLLLHELENGCGNGQLLHMHEELCVLEGLLWLLPQLSAHLCELLYPELQLLVQLSLLKLRLSLTLTAVTQPGVAYAVVACVCSWLLSAAVSTLSAVASWLS